MHYVDEGTGEAGTMVLLHGEPVWSCMYRKAIPELAAAGYRVIAPDNIGFGKSDKVIDLAWYILDHHVETLEILIEELDLRNITIVVNDWGGPNRLILATEHPDRFDHLVILNTWLHHECYHYTDALREWNVRSQRINFSNRPGGAGSALQAHFDSTNAVAGALRWPWMLPFEQPKRAAARQERAFNALAS